MLKRMLLVLLGVMGIGIVFLVVDDEDRIFAQGPKGSGPRSVTGTLGGGFTYQGTLKQGTTPVDGACQIAFALYATPSGGSPVATPITQALTLSSGQFTSTPLDFGSNVFDGSDRYLQLSFKCGSDTGFTPLTARQRVAAAPYALYATNANAAVTAASATNADSAVTATNATTATNFTGSLSGDVTGTQDNNVVTKLQQRTVASTVPTAGQVLQWDTGLQMWKPGDAGGHYQNVIVVAKSGGDFATIGEALTSIGTNATESNRYLVYVAPGTYAEAIRMKPWVDIEGAGENVTKITSSLTSTSVNTGTVAGASNAELRFLTVENTGGADPYGVAIYNNAAAVRLTHLTVRAVGATNTYGVYNGNSPLPPVMTSVSVTASGSWDTQGIYNTGTSTIMTDVSVNAVGSSGAGVYSSTGTPVLKNVSIVTGGGSNNSGISLLSSTPTLMNVVVTVSGGVTNFGIANSFGSYRMMNTTITVSGGSAENDGIFNGCGSNCTPTIQNSTITASGTNASALKNAAGTGTVQVNNSVISATTAITNAVNFANKVGASMLADTVLTGTGTLKCVSSYNGNYDPLNSACQ